MKLSDIAAKVTSLLSRADAAFTAELTELKALVTGEMTTRENSLTKANSDMVMAQASIADLTGKNTGLMMENATLKSDSTNLAAFNTELTNACLNGGLLVLNGPDGKPLAEDATPEAKATAAAGISIGDKFKAYQGGVTKAFAKLNLPNTMLPAAPNVVKPGQATGGTSNTMARADFFKLAPQAQLDFVKANGKITE